MWACPASADSGPPQAHPSLLVHSLRDHLCLHGSDSVLPPWQETGVHPGHPGRGSTQGHPGRGSTPGCLGRGSTPVSREGPDGSVALWAHRRSPLSADLASSQSFALLLLVSCSVVSNSLQPHGLQRARLPCSQDLLEFATLYKRKIEKPPLAPGPCEICLTAFGSRVVATVPAGGRAMGSQFPKDLQG